MQCFIPANLCQHSPPHPIIFPVRLPFMMNIKEAQETSEDPTRKTGSLPPSDQDAEDERQFPQSKILLPVFGLPVLPCEMTKALPTQWKWLIYFLGLRQSLPMVLGTPLRSETIAPLKYPSLATVPQTSTSTAISYLGGLMLGRIKSLDQLIHSRRSRSLGLK
ncbi:hypothetical protein O181_001193 [Austropuccinia psidii MF-1]|uniref:Uncharacterized protein n=1 Tax=Austropuccinia psidii MF-1 TaxID=1389203 RepID=A0A9Q3BA15_9BASI|nr:hypothetical protein [Austropuccinia psidii MF-1]